MPDNSDQTIPRDETDRARLRTFLLRACVNELRYPRICASRHCRRHHDCRAASQPDLPCIGRLHPIDLDALQRLHGLVTKIFAGERPPRPAADFVEANREHEAIMVILGCIGEIEKDAAAFRNWHRRYKAASIPPAPPSPPGPPLDAGALAREMKATLARDLARSKAMGYC